MMQKIPLFMWNESHAINLRIEFGHRDCFFCGWRDLWCASWSPGDFVWASTDTWRSVKIKRAKLCWPCSSARGHESNKSEHSRRPVHPISETSRRTLAQQWKVKNIFEIFIESSCAKFKCITWVLRSTCCFVGIFIIKNFSDAREFRMEKKKFFRFGQQWTFSLSVVFVQVGCVLHCRESACGRKEGRQSEVDRKSD